jgi:hypothetical protein
MGHTSTPTPATCATPSAAFLSDFMEKTNRLGYHQGSLIALVLLLDTYAVTQLGTCCAWLPARPISAIRPSVGLASLLRAGTVTGSMTVCTASREWNRGPYVRPIAFIIDKDWRADSMLRK